MVPSLKKAFDTLDHNILFEKLKMYGLHHKCHNWLKTYLSNRQQYVEINGVKSSSRTVRCGVAQGSILGPLLFLIYINDLPRVCKSCEVFLFADDTNITGINCSLQSFNDDLIAVTEWLNSNKLSLNFEKTVQVNLNVKHTSAFPLLAANKIINVELACKYLGVYIDSKLSFVHHINSVRERLRRQCAIVSKLRYYVPKALLIQYYVSNIKPIIQYGVLIYGCTSYANLMPILLLQKNYCV